MEYGQHGQLNLLAGNWQGKQSTWFESQEMAEEHQVTGSIWPVLGGRFMLHEYRAHCAGKSFEGMAIYGYNLEDDLFQSVWMESPGMGTAMRFAEGHRDGQLFSVSGLYDTKKEYHWKTVIELVHENHMIIRCYTLLPGTGPVKTTETIYHRI